MRYFNLNNQYIGGIGGNICSEYHGSFLINNEVDNFSIDVKDALYNMSTEVKLGGLFGYYEDYSLLYDDNENVVRKNVAIYNKVTNLTIKDSNSSSYTYSKNPIATYGGLFAGSLYVNIGSNYNLDEKGTSLYAFNSLSGSISFELGDETGNSYAGGFVGEYDQDTRGRSIVFIENNEINFSGEILGTSFKVSRLAGFISYLINEGRDATIIKNNVIKGELYNESIEEVFLSYSLDPQYTSGGLIGLLLNDGAYVEVSENVVLVKSLIDKSFFASSIFYGVGNAYGDSESAEYVVGKTYVSENAIGKDSELTDNIVLVNEPSLNNYHLSKYIWKLEENMPTLI